MKELPKGWQWTELESIGIINPRHPSNLDLSLEVSFTPMSAISENISNFNFTDIRTLKQVKKGYIHFAEGDVLIAKITPSMENGKAAVARNLVNGLGCGTTELHVIRPLGKILPDYIYNFIHQESFRKQASANMTGTAGQLRVPTNYIKSALIPLPPLNEQRRIVAKLEKILAKINTCQQRLERIPTILKRFRQSVLAAACSGRLTADWREQHPDVEPAEELLKRIQEQRKKRYKEDCVKAKAEGRRKPKSPFYKEDLTHNEMIANLPLSWTLTYLGNITDTQGGIQKTPKRKPINNPYPYLRVANVYRGYLNLDRIEYFELFDKKELNKWKLKKGDLLIVEGNGSPTEIGRCAIWNEEIDNCVHQNHIIRSRLLLNIESRFILSYLNSYQGIEIMMQLSSSTSGLHTLSVTKINNIIIPLAPLEEQQEIVRRVEELFKKCDSIEKRYQKAKKYTDKLTQSILAKAFRGELVPQDPNDEPAEILLERIRAEKAEQEKQTKAKKKTKRKTTSTKKRSQTKPRQLEIPDMN